MNQRDPEFDRELAELRRNIRVVTWELARDGAVLVALIAGVALLVWGAQ